jgi:hypothetical protein
MHRKCNHAHLYNFTRATQECADHHPKYVNINYIRYDESLRQELTTILTIVTMKTIITIFLRVITKKHQSHNDDSSDDHDDDYHNHSTDAPGISRSPNGVARIPEKLLLVQ